MDENRYTNDYYTNRNQMNQGQVNQNQNSSSGTQGTNYYQTSSTNFQQPQMNHQQTKPAVDWYLVALQESVFRQWMQHMTDLPVPKVLFPQ